MTSAQRRKYASQLVQDLDSSFFRALGEEVRVELLKFLMIQGSSDVSTIAEHMPQDRSVISRHLRVMHQAGLVTCVRQGRHCFYDVDCQSFLNKVRSIAQKIECCMIECEIPIDPE